MIQEGTCGCLARQPGRHCHCPRHRREVRVRDGLPLRLEDEFPWRLAALLATAAGRRAESSEVLVQIRVAESRGGLSPEEMRYRLCHLA
ncbi:MAG: hypothetical protein KDH15_08290 [Rhodocyclaceae bacterium]|nr:hypothetical protein [Rhodocyclaceae bacterium]